MGIPSYFSQIIRKYTKILRNKKYFKDNHKPFTHLYMDCNSIIYDSYYDIINKECEINDFEKLEKDIIEKVVKNIDNYIQMINPTNTIYIAFDGVAPLAKMEQQRTRRYKSLFTSNAQSKLMNENFNKWNTSSITPGTLFMDKLSRYTNFYFQYKETQYNVKKIIISCSDEPGEGEHKLYSHIRNNNVESSNIAIYGLDADLIMLSIFHLKYCKDIYVFREAPEFLKNSIPLNVKEHSNEPYFLDIHCFSLSILTEMNCSNNDLSRIDDYVFMCFLLGNDFLPHFPSMNIRTHGISVLLDIYKKYISNSMNRYLISPYTKQIQWNNVKIFINEISKCEHELLKKEYFVRDKFDKRKFPETTIKEKEEVLLNVPILYRQEEKYICPDELYWEDRYYKILFKSLGYDDSIKDISINYLEGLEWVYKYYTGECPDWKWKYKYNYPPLFNDLNKYIPHFETDFLKSQLTNSSFTPFHPYTQLSYVLPRNNLYLLPKKIQGFLLDNYSNLYPEEYKFQWAFCRYFWESHPILPEITNDELEKWNCQFSFFHSL